MILKSVSRYNKRKSVRIGKKKMGSAVPMQKVNSLTARTKSSRARAYVLFHTLEGCSGDVVSTLLQNRHVLSVDMAEGPPDIVAIIEASSRTKLAAAVVKALSTIGVMVDGVDLLPA